MDSAMREAVAQRLKALELEDVEALKKLPAHRIEALPAMGKVQIIQHHEVKTSGEHLVVVQALRQRWLGLFTAIEVDGFVIDKEGTKRPMTDREKWPFI